MGSGVLGAGGPLQSRLGAWVKAVRSISVALLTRNGMATLPAVLDALAAQQVDAEVELVAVDTASTDGSAELLRERADRVVNLRPEDFNHGTTRNLAVEHCSGDLVVMLVQDAIPASRRWLTRLTTPFDEDPRLAGAVARQLPTNDASRLTRWVLARWVLAQRQPFTHGLDDPAAWPQMAPMDRFMLSVFDNVCSCLRRSVWERFRFAPTAIAEDLEWGRDVLLGGHRLRYVPEAAVYHSHQRGPRYELERTYLVHKRLYELFGVRTIPTAGALARSVASTVAEHRQVLRSGDGPAPDLPETLRALGLAFAWPLGQYLGGRAGVSGTTYLRPRGV